MKRMKIRNVNDIIDYNNIIISDIGSILFSFFSVKEKTKLCLISKTWNYKIMQWYTDIEFEFIVLGTIEYLLKKKKENYKMDYIFIKLLQKRNNIKTIILTEYINIDENLMDCIKNIKKLTLKIKDKNWFNVNYIWFDKFNNLKELVINEEFEEFNYLSYFNNLIKLTISDIQTTNKDEDNKMFDNLNSLKELIIKDCNYGDNEDTLFLLKKIPKDNLLKIELFCCYDIELIKIIIEFKNIKTLYLSYTYLSAINTSHLKQLNNIEYLHIDYASINQIFKSIPNNIKQLKLGLKPYDNDSSQLDGIENFKNLNLLDITSVGRPFNKEDLLSLTRLNNLEYLKITYINDFPIDFLSINEKLKECYFDGVKHFIGLNYSCFSNIKCHVFKFKDMYLGEILDYLSHESIIYLKGYFIVNSFIYLKLIPFKNVFFSKVCEFRLDEEHKEKLYTHDNFVFKIIKKL